MWFFHENVQKSSIPKCQELSLRCHFYLDFPMKKPKKARYPNVMNLASHVSFIWFFHENVQTSSIPKCLELRLRCHFYLNVPWKCQKKLDTQMSRIRHPISFVYGFFSWKCEKKLDTQMSRIKHMMSFLSGFFHENVKKSSIPKCQELSIWCHFYLDFSMKMSKKARYPNVMN